MAQGIAQRPQVEDLPLQVVGLRMQLRTRNFGLPIPAEHAGDLGERKAGSLAQADQRQFEQHVAIELPAQSPPSFGNGVQRDVDEAQYSSVWQS